MWATRLAHLLVFLALTPTEAAPSLSRFWKGWETQLSTLEFLILILPCEFYAEGRKTYSMPAAQNPIL